MILGNNDNLREPSEIIKEFKDLIPRLDDSEKLRIFYSGNISGNISVIISGKFDKENSSEYTTLKKEELDFYITPSINNPKLDDCILYASEFTLSDNTDSLILMILLRSDPSDGLIS